MGPSSSSRPSRRTVLAATAGTTAALTLSTTSVRAAEERPDESSLRALVSRMTLEEKVGQLFVMRVYGHSATAPDQADIDTNLEELGVRTAAELIAEYRVGGIIYFTWAHNTRDPHQIAALSNGIQKVSSTSRAGCPSSSPPTRSTERWPGWASPRRCSRARWRSARAARGRTPVRWGASAAPSCAPSASDRTTPRSPT